MKFQYKKVAEGIWRPIITVRLANGNESFQCEALVDSGADLSLFPAVYGEGLGIDVSAGKKESIGGINTGGGVLYEHNITISVGGHEHDVIVGFMPDMSTQNHGILGQLGLFDLYQVTFSYLKGEIQLREYNDKVKRSW